MSVSTKSLSESYVLDSKIISIKNNEDISTTPTKNNVEAVSSKLVGKISKDDERYTHVENALAHNVQDKKIVPINVPENPPTQTGKKITAASMATTAVASGTAVALSGVAAWLLEQGVGLAIYLSYAPTNPLSQYLMAEMAAGMAASIVSATALATITNIAAGVLVAIGVIFTGVTIYNLFIAETEEDKISIFGTIGKTISAAFHLVF